MDIDTASETCTQVLDAISEAVIADRSFLETVLTGVLARGHVLLEDVPGTGKTLTARSVATALGLSFSRVQFTPDLLPTDVTGTNIYDERDRTFEFSPGPIFANVVLADEINRAPPKTQAALLEAMEEGQVTVDGETHQLPTPFFVIATQNPVEQEGTFTLPEAQVDRFVVKSAIGYPDVDGEVELLRRRAGRTEQSPSVECVLDRDSVVAIRRAPESVRVDDDLLRYMADLARETRTDRRVRIGVSPRGTQRLFEATRARAVIEGREFVTPDDVKHVTQSVLAHRLVLTPDARVEDVQKSDVVADVLGRVAVPTLD
ncbi:MoxR family ATPase [Haloferax mediterranei ATCC 33500]|uniref:ATPase n=1 Tax=Haloferax mediterranei (strain ATCC 33500 / DSM 1411 / JCM 8866 / NBRC 14739 / NCIMB 2177 / R-4) TaxID=523841 RepID=I3R278_HALMT|nr:MoxR family ATPase [Haloferax mediterranei]AFK18338.1 methanol dehydrogenase regulatory protein [Haloferax mediterranei ATCC 33500]AHZ22265.1 ATPase [Haloferax mediterranei ATCC 33500]EMA02391.1 methanol dehydrogenase regulatory protein [Haloferax mediterranei ATCC 33500]MDX5988427.1 MoxR family ATPase [Haloferax mediterranei ATCC 33500]QCQ74851.1 MoxR family ATPase [Haloferax mediterranei ATCC 33500]